MFGNSRRLISRLLIATFTAALALCLFCVSASAADIMDSTTVAAMRKLIGTRDYDEGDALSVTSDSAQAVDWLESYQTYQIASVVNTMEDMEQMLGELSISPLLSNMPSALSTAERLDDEIGYYCENMSLARLRLESLLDELRDDPNEAPEPLRQQYWEECERLYQKLKAWTAEVAQAQGQWINDCTSVMSTVYGNEFMNWRNSALDKYTVFERGLTSVEQLNAQDKFVVEALSDKEIGVSVVELKKDKSIRIKDATVVLTDADGNAHTATTNENGVAKFMIADFKPDKNNRVWVGYYVSKDGYKSYGETRIRLKGGQHAAAVLVKGTSDPYISVLCFNGYDIQRVKKRNYYITPKNDADQTFVLRLENLTAGKKWTVSMRYGRLTGTEIAHQTATKDNPIVTFKGKWGRDLPKGYQIWFTIKKEGDWFSTTINTQFFTEEAPMQEPSEDKGSELNFIQKMAGKLGDAWKWAQNSGLDMTPFQVKVNAFLDYSGSVIITVNGDIGPLTKDWKSNDQKALDEFYQDVAKEAAKERAGIIKNAIKTSHRTRENPFMKKISIGINAGGSLKGTYNPSSKKLSLDGAIAIKLGLSIDISKTFFAGPVPILVGVDFSLSAGLDIPAFQLNWDLGRARFISAHFQMADTKLSVMVQGGLSAGFGFKGLASLTVRGYASINPIVMLRRISKLESCVVKCGLEVSVQVAFFKYTQNIGQATWDLVNSVEPTMLERFALTDVESASTRVPTVAEVNASNVTISQSALPFLNTGADSVGGSYAEKDLGKLVGTSGNLVQGYSFGEKAFYLSMEKVDVGGGKKLTRVIVNIVTTLGNGDLQHTRKVVQMTGELAGQTVQDYYLAYSLKSNAQLAGLLIVSGSNENPKSLKESAEGQRIDLFVASGVDLAHNNGDFSFVSNKWRVETNPGYYALSPRAALYTIPTDSSHIYAWCGYMLTELPKDESKPFQTKTCVGNVLSKYQRGGGWLFLKSFIANAPEDEYLDDMAVAHNASSFGIPTLYYTTTKRGETNSSRLYYRNVDSATAKAHVDGCFVNLRRLGSSSRVLCMEKKLNRGNEYSFGLVSFNYGEKKDYGITTNSPVFGTTLPGTTALYVNWVKTSIKQHDLQGKETTLYTLMGTRFDTKSGLCCEPYQFAETSQFPMEYIPLFFKTQGSRQLVSIYTTPIDQKSSFDKTTEYQLRLHVMNDAIKMDLLNADAYDPIVTSGEEAEFYVTVHNTGTMPINSFKVQYSCAEYPNWNPVISIDCQNPKSNNQVQNQDINGNNTTLTGYHNAYMLLNSEECEDGTYLTVVDTQYDDNGRVLSTNKEIKYYRMLMPQTKRTYSCKVMIPKEFVGKLHLSAKVMQPSGVSNPAYGMVTLKDGAIVETQAEQQAWNDSLDCTLYALDASRNVSVTERKDDGTGTIVASSYSFDSNGSLLAGAPATAPALPFIAGLDTAEINTVYNDLTLKAELLHEDSIGDYITAHVSNHSSFQSPDGTTTLSLNLDGSANAAWSYDFKNNLTELYSYNLIIPLSNVVGNQEYSQLGLSVAGKASATGDYNEFSLADNAVDLTFSGILRFTQQPVSVLPKLGDRITFGVEVTGGSMPYSFQWETYINGSWVPIVGATDKSYTTPRVTDAMLGRLYRCVVTDSDGSEIISAEAGLLKSAPVTGDSSPLALYAALCLMALLGLSALVIRARRKCNQ